jgi:hypothetical protein
MESEPLGASSSAAESSTPVAPLWAYPDNFEHDREALLRAYREGRVRIVVTDDRPADPSPFPRFHLFRKRR